MNDKQLIALVDWVIAAKARCEATAKFWDRRPDLAYEGAAEYDRDLAERCPIGCHAGQDGDCTWIACPQARNYRAVCPLWVHDPEL